MSGSHTMLFIQTDPNCSRFIIDLYTYPGAWINSFVALGLLYLQFSPSEAWTSPFHSYVPMTVIFLLSNVFLVVVPFIPPTENSTSYPYYVFPLVGVGVLLLGVLYWGLWAKVWPKLGGYKVVAERVILNEDQDGAGQEVIRYRKVKIT
jgi:hypothetical protein